MSMLWLITDQQRHDAIGCKSDFCKTPNLDRLAKTGTIFSNCYAQSPQCHPSRVSLMTGRYPSAHRSQNNDCCLRPEEITISSILAKNQFNCAYFGKMHLAGNERDDRELMDYLGYSSWFTYLDWIDLCRAVRKTVPITPYDEFTNIMQSRNWVGKFSRRDLQHDEIIVDRAIEYITSTDNFFVVVSFYGPHPPYASPPPFCEMYKPGSMTTPIILGERSAEEWQQIKAQYYGNIGWIDNNIGRILDVIAEDTIVMFTSDHGDILGDHGYFSKGFFGYEGNIRVPLIIRSPELARREYTHLAQHIDVLPTMLDLVDLELPECVQGESLVSAIQVNRPIRDYALSMLDADTKLKIIRTENLKYWVGEQERLFDLQNDPQEQYDLTGDEDYAIELSNARKCMLLALIAAEAP